MPATLPHLLRSDSLQHRSASARPSQAAARYSPANNRPILQHTTLSMHSRRVQAGASTRLPRRPRRCTRLTAKVQHYQPRHPEETRCQRRCPIVSDLITCTHRSPIASRHPLQPRQQPPQPSPQRTAPSMHSRQSQASTHSATADSARSDSARSVPLRCSDVSCVIINRLGASEATPSSPIWLSAASQRLDSPLASRHPLQPREQPPQPSPQHAASSMQSQRLQAPAYSTTDADCSVQKRSSDVSCIILKRLSASDAAPSSPIGVSASTAAHRLAARKPLAATAPTTTIAARNAQHHPCAAGDCKQPPAARSSPMRATYLRGSATSAASSFRDSVPDYYDTL